MKTKRITSWLLVLTVLLSLCATTAFADGSDYTAGLTVTKVDKSKLSVGVQVGPSGLSTTIRSAQSFVVAYDTEVLKALFKDGATEVTGLTTEPPGAGKNMAYYVYEDADFDVWETKVHPYLSGDGKTGFLIIQPTNGSGSTLKGIVTLAAVYLGFQTGKSYADVTPQTVRFATSTELEGKAEPNAIQFNDGTTYTWSNGGKGDTLFTDPKNQPAVAASGFTFAKPALPALAGAVTVDGTPKIGETLTANTSGITSGSPGALTYKWYYEGTSASIGSGNTYVLSAAADVGKTIKVDVSAANYSGSLTGTAGKAVEKANGPDGPTISMVSKTDHSITVTPNENWEYTKDDGAHVQSSNVFTGLNPNITYSIKARVKENAIQKASAWSTQLLITTDAKDYSLAAGFNAAQTTVKGDESFTEPTFTDVDGNDVKGTITYTVSSVAKTAEEIKSLLKTKKVDESVTVDYSFIASGSFYGKTPKTGSFTITVKDIEFKVGGLSATIGNALTVKAAPAYGDTWAEIVQISEKLEAYVGAEKKAGTFTLVQTGAPNAGSSIAYQVVFNGSGYTDVSVLSGTVDVAPKTLTKADLEYIGAAITKVYDGNTTCSLSAVSVKKGVLVGSDTLTVSGAAVYDSTNGAATKVTFTPNAITTGNYRLAASETLDIPAGITPKAISINTATATNRDYAEGDTSVAISAVTFNDAVDALVAGADYTVTGEMADADAGAGKSVTATVTLTGTAAANYTLAANTKATTVTINKIAYTGSITETKNVLTNKAQTGVEVDLTGKISGITGAAVTAAAEGSDASSLIDNVAVTGNKVTFDVANLATVNTTATINVTISSTNYSDITAVITVKTVDKADAGVKLGAAPTAKTYGDADFTVTASAANTGANDGWTWASSDPAVLQIVSGDTATATVRILKSGSAALTAKYESDTTIGQATGASVTVSKATITVAAKNQSIYVMGTAPDLSAPVENTHYTVTGLVGSDVLGGTIAMEYQEKGSPVTPVVTAAGTYDIVVSGATNPDANKYNDIVFTNGTLTIIDLPSAGGYVPSYSIAALDAEHGSLSLNKTNAYAGSKITVTATPDKDYELSKLTATNKNGKAIELKKEADGSYSFEMPASNVEVKAEFQAVVYNPFVDVTEGAYYYDAILWALQNKITEGTDANIFDPIASSTRAQIVTFLWRAVGSPEVAISNPFADVQEAAYYYDAVMWAVEKGITEGTSATTFSPDDTCTRAQIVTFLYRFAGEQTVEQDISFTDVADDVYYAEAVKWAVAEKITEGTSANTFSPNAFCTRAQAVTFLYRYFVK